MSRSPSIARQIANGVGWSIMIAGAALALLIAGPLALGDNPHTDLSGSMEPAIAPGDVVIDEEIKPMNASVGDIVTFRDPQDQSKLLTHRVVAIDRKSTRLTFTTQGDANNTQEHWQVPARGQIGRVMYVVPWVGHVAVLARTGLGWALLVGIPLALLAVEELVRIWRPRERLEGGGPLGGVG